MQERISSSSPHETGQLSQQAAEHVASEQELQHGLDPEDEVLQLSEHQMMTPEQSEAHDRIAKIDENLRKLDLIINSVDKRAMSDGRHENSASAKKIAELDNQLMEMTIAGEDTSELEAQLFELKSKQKEGDEFYDNENHLMFSASYGYDLGNAPEKLRNQPPENISESTEKLLSVLEEMGLDREEFIAKLNSGRRAEYREADHVEQLLREFRGTLVQQRNTERLSLPNELPKMTGEIIAACDAGDIKFKELFPHGEDRFSDINVSQIFQKLPFAKSVKLDAYPKEAQQQFFTVVAKRMMESVGGNTYEADALGKDLVTLRSLEGEQFRSKEDIAFEIDSLKKVEAYVEAEEQYLRTALKDGIQFRLEDKIDEFGIRYDSERKDEWAEETPVWPIVDSDVKFAVERIRERGGVMLREFDFADRYREVMTKALALVKEANPRSRKVDPIEIVIAMRRAAEQVRVELETLEIEQDHLEMHTKDLAKLRGKAVTFAR